jgi:hypothetical protein
MDQLDDEDRTEPAFLAANELLELLGAEIEVDDAGEDTSPQGATRAHALFGKRYHVNLPRATWKLFLACVPILIALIRAQADPLAWAEAGTSALSALDIARESINTLSPPEVAISLAVREINRRGKAAETDAVLGLLRGSAGSGDPLPPAEVEKSLETLVSRGVLTKDGSGYKLT